MDRKRRWWLLAVGLSVLIGSDAFAQVRAKPQRKAADSTPKAESPQTPAPAAPSSEGAPAESSKPPADESTDAKPKEPKRMTTELATFGGGCFWCLEAVYERMPGVKAVVSGYSGGVVPNPSYEMVCSGETGHAEVVQIEYFPEIITYDQLLDAFWKMHDPTTLNRQGPDVGTQYRSVIFVHNDEQRMAAEKSRAEAQSHFGDPIVTQIVPLQRFFVAETYHQDYFRKHPSDPYCRMMIPPKLKKFGLSGKPKTTKGK